MKAGVHLIDRCGAQFVAPPSMSYCRGEHRLLSTIHIKPMNHTHTHFRSSILPTLPYFAFPSRQASPVAARSFVRPSVCYHACDHDILKTNQPILLNIGTSGARCDEMKRSTLGGHEDKGRRSNDAEVRFGGLAEPSLSTRSVE